MTRKEKVLAIIARRIEKQIHFLALRNNPADPAHGGDFYYVITGGVDAGEPASEAVLREIDEETGITRFLRIIRLPLVREFEDKYGQLCREEMFGLVTEEDVSHLSIEHIEWEWWQKEEFVKRIVWFGSREELAGLLDEIEKAANLSPNSASSDQTTTVALEPSWQSLLVPDKSGSDQ